MATSNINIRVDNAVKKEAQEVFSSLGMDMTTAINIFLRQAIRLRSIPFPVAAVPEKKTSKRGSMKGKISMIDDFDTPNDKQQNENLLVVTAVEEYSRRQGITANETLRLFNNYGVTEAIRQCYETLHTQDIFECVSFAEDILKMKQCKD